MPRRRNWISSDWPHFFRTELEAPLRRCRASRWPARSAATRPRRSSPRRSRACRKQFVDASHPAGCRTLFEPNGDAGAGRLRPGDEGARRAARRRGRRRARPARASGRRRTPSGARAGRCASTLTNQLFVLGAQLGVFAARPGYADNCTVEHPARAQRRDDRAPSCSRRSPRSASATASSCRCPARCSRSPTSRSFLGPQDMPNPQYPLPAWVIAAHARAVPVRRRARRRHARLHLPAWQRRRRPRRARLGRRTPTGSGAATPTTARRPPRRPATSSGPRSSACSTRPTVAPEPSSTGRYVLPDGTLSRNPLGQPGSIKCNVDTVFTTAGSPRSRSGCPADATGQVVVPAAWMSLSGRRQLAPDRNTRGLDRRARHAPLARRLSRPQRSACPSSRPVVNPAR